MARTSYGGLPNIPLFTTPLIPALLRQVTIASPTLRKWRPQPDSNRRPPAYHAGALPSELYGHTQDQPPTTVSFTLQEGHYLDGYSCSPLPSFSFPTMLAYVKTSKGISLTSPLSELLGRVLVVAKCQGWIFCESGSYNGPTKRPLYSGHYNKTTKSVVRQARLHERSDFALASLASL